MKTPFKEYQDRLDAAKRKALEKYGDDQSSPEGNLAHDAIDYTINELVELDRYLEMTAARLRIYSQFDTSAEKIEMSRIAAKELCLFIIKQRQSLLLHGMNLGRPQDLS